METEIKIVDLTAENVNEYGIGCISNPNHIGYEAKRSWLKKRFSEKLKIKLLMEGNKVRGFLEYVPGEVAWRAVDVKGYLCIHCIWVFPKKYRGKKYGSRLIQECLEEARKQNKNGVAVVTSEGAWIAGRDLFLKHGFKVVDKKGRFELLVRKFTDAEDPKFKEVNVKKYEELNLLYSDQCPMASKFVEDIKKYCKEDNIDLKITKLENPQAAQDNPCAYGIFSVVYNGKVVADNPISATRFKNIVIKELGPG